ncbi:MAG: EutP/PduV family microcompartment system protein [Clostridia bacterium]|nr:EutP/PduV family microcompartment system protein [Clostridia bacterium]
MKKLMLIGRVAAGKTTLTQALRGEQIHYCKTQYINYSNTIIDTPGEYTEVNKLGAALAIYAYEADIVGIVISADEPFCVFPPNITCMVNREVIGIVSGIDKPSANVEQATRWLKLCGCTKIFYISSYTGEGLSDIIEYLREDGDAPDALPV